MLKYFFLLFSLSLSLSPFLSLSLSLSFSLSLYLSISLSVPLPPSFSHYLSLSLAHTHTLPLCILIPHCTVMVFISPCISSMLSQLHHLTFILVIHCFLFFCLVPIKEIISEYWPIKSEKFWKKRKRMIFLS